MPAMLPPGAGAGADADADADAAANMRALRALVLVGSADSAISAGNSPNSGDTWQSEFFGHAGAAESPPELLRETNAYRRDWLGLRTLDERGALAVLDCRCTRAQLSAEPASLISLFNESLVPFLRAPPPTIPESPSQRDANDAMARPAAGEDYRRVRGERVDSRLT